MQKLVALLLCLGSFSILHSQNILISEIADPDNNEFCRYVEIFCEGPMPCNLVGHELQRWTNGNAAPTTSTNIPLGSLGTLQPGEVALIASSSTSFFTCYGFNPNINGGTGGPADSNGDDQIAIINSGGDIIDIFGVPGEDGTGTCHEFEDGRAERISSVTLSNPIFDEAEWCVWADSPVSGCTCHTNMIQNVSNMTPGITTLPVELVRFRIQKSGLFHKLNWKTLSEINNEKFEIERSSNGLYFTRIGSVRGNGDSYQAKDYTFMDEKPEIGMNYYRLKQIDFDGNFTYSDIIRAENTHHDIRVYPSSTANYLNIESSQESLSSYEIRSISGQLIDGQQLESGLSSIDVSFVPNGLNYITITSGSTTKSFRFIKN